MTIQTRPPALERRHFLQGALAVTGIPALLHSGRRTYTAMNRSCTHNGAQGTYNHKRRTVRCTSLNHAGFDLPGTLLRGRTHGNPRTYPAMATARQVTIALEPHA